MSELRRDLGLVDAVGIGLGAIIGAGIFVVTGVAAQVAGPAFLLGLCLAGVAATCNALSSAQLAAAYPYSGGTYEYGYRVLNPWLGFSAGWMFLVSKLAAAGTVALGFAGYLSALVPGAPEKIAAALAVIVLTIINYFGVKKAGRLNTVVVSVTVLALVAFALSGIPEIQTDNFHPFAPKGLKGVLESAALLFFAYTGYARLATLGEEVHEPKKTIPKAIGWTIVIAIVLYGVVAVAAIGLVGAENLGSTRSPLVLAAKKSSLPFISTVVSVGATTAMLGVLLSQILGISRMSYAMARRKDLPAFLGHVHKKYQVPDRGIVLAGVVILGITFIGSLKAVVSTTSFTILLYYTVTNLAALRMPKSEKLFRDWVPYLGLASCLLLAFSLNFRVIAFGVALLVVGLLTRSVFRGAREEK